MSAHLLQNDEKPPSERKVIRVKKIHSTKDTVNFGFKPYQITNNRRGN